MATATEQHRANGHDFEQSPLDASISETNRILASRPELMQMKMENETIITECRARPRDFAQIKKGLSELLEAFPEFADSALYCKPVGKDDNNTMKYAEGLSIRAAESLAEAYKYNRIRADVTPTPEGAKIDATFTDFQTGRIWQDASIVSKFYKARQGGMRSIPDDRFWDVTVKAVKSKLIREVILRSVNSALKAWFENECRKMAALRLTDDRVKEILEQFKQIKVSRIQLEDFIGKPITMGWSQNDRLKLLGLYNAINNGETTIAEAFAPPAEENKSKAPEGPVSGNDLANPKRSAQQPEQLSSTATQLSEADRQEIEIDMETAIKACSSPADIAKFRKSFSKLPELCERMAEQRLQEIS